MQVLYQFAQNNQANTKTHKI